jgi:hypothetical protein
LRFGFPFRFGAVSTAPVAALRRVAASSDIAIDFDPVNPFGATLDVAAGTATTPDLIDSARNAGTMGGTFAAAGTARPCVAHHGGYGRAWGASFFDGSNDALACSLPKADYRWLHSDSFDLVLCGTRQSSSVPWYALSSATTGLTSVGTLLSVGSTVTALVQQGGGVASYGRVTGVGSVPQGAMRVFRCRVASGQITLSVYSATGSWEGSAAVVGLPSGADSTLTLGLGNMIPHSYRGGNVHALFARRTPYTDAEFDAILAYLRQRMDPAWESRLAFTADGGFIFDPSSALLPDGRWPDLSGNAHTGTLSGDPVIQPTAFNGRPGLVCGGVSNTMIINPGAGWSASQIHCLMAAASGSGAGRLLDAQTGPLAMRHHALSGHVYDGAWRLTGAGLALDVERIAEWEAEAAVATRIRENGGAIASDAATARAMGGMVRMVSAHDGSDPWAGTLGQVVYGPRVGTAAARDEVNAAVGGLY